MAAPALPHIRRAAENGCSSMQAHSSSRVSLWSDFPNFVQKLWGLILPPKSQCDPIRIHNTTFKLLYFIIFIQHMIFTVILKHVSIILDRKRPHNFQTKFENSGHSGTQEATERQERSGTTFARQPQAHQWETRTFNRPYVCPKNNGMLHMCRILLHTENT